MYFVYILHSESADKFYIGFTSNLDGRVEAHNHPQNKGWTKRFTPWSMVYSETFETKQMAIDRERKLKSFKNKEIIRKIINSK